MSDFGTTYGPWALVAGGAQGIGAAFARYVAARHVNVIVLDIEQSALDAMAATLPTEFGVECLAVNVDLAAPDMLEQVVAAVGAREVGLMIYNAGIADVGPFYKADTDLAFEKKRIAVNVTGPMVLTYHFARPMIARKSGGIVLMSSGAGLTGAPYYSAYSATKAYDIALGQALWGEFRRDGVDVLAVAAGMTLSTAAKGYQHLDTSGFQTPDELVQEAMAALGQQSLVIAGKSQREGRELMKQLPDEQVIEYMAKHAIDNFLGGTPPQQVI